MTRPDDTATDPYPFAEIMVVRHSDNNRWHRRRWLRRVTYLCALLLIAGPFTAHAQDTVTGAFESVVTNSETGEPIAGALIEIINQQTNVRLIKESDSKGRFYQGLLTPGMYRLVFSAPGFERREILQRLLITRTGEVVPFPTLKPITGPGAFSRGGIAVLAVPNAKIKVDGVGESNSFIFYDAVPPDEVLRVIDSLPAGEYVVTVTLEGYRPAEKRVVVLPFKTTPVTVKLQQSEASARLAAQAGKYYALIIGNNDYEHFGDLKTAQADAQAVETVLRERFGFETKLLLDAPREKIFNEIYSYVEKLGSDANLLVYYAGHGHNDKDLGASWLPVNASRSNPANWISSDEITKSIKKMKAKHVLIVSDSCYSGALTRDVEADLGKETKGDAYLERMLSGVSRRFISSGGDEPVADGGGAGHSVFAEALLTGFSQMDRDIFTARELFINFVERPVIERAKQTPAYNPLASAGHASGDFVFIRRKQ